MFLRSLALAAVIGLLGSAARAEAPRVVVTIKPIHSLVSSVMGTVGEPTLIIRDAASPHTYSLAPSAAQALQEADIVFWAGHGLETFLEDAIETIAPGALSVELSQSPGITLLPLREGGAFEAHEEDEVEGDTADEGSDMHFFLDPQRAKVLVDHIASQLSLLDPQNAPSYATNAQATTAALDSLIAESTARLAPVREKPFVVFHDAFQYFERAFDLNVVGTLTVNPEIAPGAERINEIRARLRGLEAGCAFAEPQFDPRIMDVLIEGTVAKRGTLDPEGATLVEGRDLYFALIRSLTDSLLACLD